MVRQKKLLMVAGPVKIEKEVLKIGAMPQEYMRTSDYSQKWERIFCNLKYIFQTKNPVICYSSSGTGAMEAAVTNFICKNDTIMYINAGIFGKRWGEICKKHHINTVEILVKPEENVSAETIAEILRDNSNIKAVFVTLNETSYGSLQNICDIGRVIKQYNNILFIVDCVSGLCSDKFLMDEWGVDVAISASQKALALPPGLAFMAFNKKSLEFAAKSDLRTFYFDIFEYLKNLERNQTPFTPPTGIINQLEYRLNKIKAEGLEDFQKRYKYNTKVLREELIKLNFKTFAKNPANCVTAIKTDKFNAYEIIKIMRDKYNIELAPSGGELKEKMFRVCNYGDIGRSEIKRFIKCLKLTLGELKAFQGEIYDR